MEKLKRVIIYIRVSTREQVDGYSIAEQKERLLAFCKAHGWIVVKIYVDPGHSGSTLERPGIESVMNSVQEGIADIVLVYKLDRLSRSQKDTLFLIEDVFLAHDTHFVSMQESFDTSTPFGRAMVGILAVFAQLERENIKERTMMGRAGRAKEGNWHGGGFDPIGYDYIDGELIVNPTEAEQVQRVYELFLNGSTITDITHKMKGYETKHGDWSNPQTVASVLDNELYAGTIHFDGVRTPNSHTAIIDNAAWSRVHHARTRNKKTNYQPKRSEHLLTGLVFCSQCGARYFAKKNSNGNVFYCCHSRAKKNKRMIKDLNCRNKNFPKYALETIIEERVKEIIQNPFLINEIIKKNRAEDGSVREKQLNTVREEIDGINGEIDRLMDLYKTDRMPVEEIANKIDELHTHKVLLSSSINEDESPSKDFHIEAIKSMVFGFDWESEKIDKQRYLLRQLVDSIHIDEDEVYINWSFV